MMKKMKKSIAIISCICMSAMFLLTGCKKDEPVQRVGSKVPSRFTESSDEEIKDVKAKNFSYDENNMNYKLVWSDEFDYDGLPNPDKWNFEVADAGWVNNELQCYTNGANAEVTDGKLIITLRKEDFRGANYTSSRLTTKGKGDFTYGKFEIRAKLPKGLGTWPAIWMMPTKSEYGGWPNSGEIDIMEHVGYDQGVIHATIHTENYNHTKNTQKYNTTRIDDCSEEFHVYGLEWLPDKMIFSVDGNEYFTYKPTDYLENPTSGEWPYDKDFFLILNIAFGGNWGGSKGIDEELTQATMEVDYVRVYQSNQVSYIKRDASDTLVENPFLKADGKVLRNNSGTGDLIQLKGTNVGGYLLQEFWMTMTDASAHVKAESDIYSTLIDRFGEEKAYELIDTYEDAFFTEEDFDYCKSLGMNCLRLPMWWRNFCNEDGTLRENAFDRVDKFVEEAGKRGIYVILDMHGAPGSQSGSDHSAVDGGDDKIGASKFFFGDKEEVENNQRIFYELWEEIAKHYRENPWVAGYDLLNEPYCTYRYNSGYTDSALHDNLWAMYDEAYKRIREIDTDHVIIMEATWDPVDLPNPEKFGWENVMYQYHNYLYDDYDNAKGQQITNMNKKLTAIASANYNVPSLLGEFSLMNNYDAWDEGLRLINSSGISWTTWTYKVISSNGNWGIRHQKNLQVNVESNDYDRISEAWSKAGESSENNKLAEVLKKYYFEEYFEDK